MNDKNSETCNYNTDMAIIECGHQGVVHGQLQKTEAPDRLTGIASLPEDQSDATRQLQSGFILAYT